jgi:hypothetical protein
MFHCHLLLYLCEGDYFALGHLHVLAQVRRLPHPANAHEPDSDLLCKFQGTGLSYKKRNMKIPSENGKSRFSLSVSAHVLASSAVGTCFSVCLPMSFGPHFCRG